MTFATFRRWAGLLTVLGLVSFAASALAQGVTRSQGREVTPSPASEAETDGQLGVGLRDYREDMRHFVQAIAEYARAQRPGFFVLAQDGLELLVKREILDETQTAPARTYMRTLDGQIVRGVYYGVPEFGEPTEERRQEFILPLAEQAKAARLPILGVDFAREPEIVRDAFRKMSAQGFVPYIAPGRGLDMNRLPAYARSPWNINPNSILTPRDARNFLYLRDSSGFGRQDEFALTIHGTNFDMVIVDVYHGRTPLSPRAIETMRYKKLGSKRPVLAYVNIGFADAAAFYWQSSWDAGNPYWIGDPLPGEPDRYRVDFWRPEWQTYIYGNTQSYIYGLIDLGFDGAVLDGLDAFYFFEGELPAITLLP